MFKNYCVKMTTQAEEQLRDILYYISSTLNAPDASFRTLSLLENSISSLSDFPERIPIVSEPVWFKYKIHKMSVNQFLLYFWIDEHHDTVFILAIVYASCDQMNVLDSITLWFNLD